MRRTARSTAWWPERPGRLWLAGAAAAGLALVALGVAARWALPQGTADRTGREVTLPGAAPGAALGSGSAASQTLPAPLSDDVLVLWLDESTPLYLTLDPNPGSAEHRFQPTIDRRPNGRRRQKGNPR